MAADVTHACVAADASSADPAVRVGAFVDAFGDNGVRLSICGDSFTPALLTIAGKIGEKHRPVTLQASSMLRRCRLLADHYFQRVENLITA